MEGRSTSIQNDSEGEKFMEMMPFHSFMLHANHIIDQYTGQYMMGGAYKLANEIACEVAQLFLYDLSVVPTDKIIEIVERHRVPSGGTFEQSFTTAWTNDVVDKYIEAINSNLYFPEH